MLETNFIDHCAKNELMMKLHTKLPPLTANQGRRSKTWWFYKLSTKARQFSRDALRYKAGHKIQVQNINTYYRTGNELIGILGLGKKL